MRGINEMPDDLRKVDKVVYVVIDLSDLERVFLPVTIATQLFNPDLCSHRVALFHK